MGPTSILDLADEFFRLVRDRVPMDFLRTDMTMRQLKVMYTLYMDGPQTVGALATAQDLALPTMTGILARLERRGYLERRRDSEDARRVISDLTGEGRELVGRLWASGRDEFAEVLTAVPPEDRQTVERALQVLVEALREQSGEARPAGVRSRDG